MRRALSLASLIVMAAGCHDDTNAVDLGVDEDLATTMEADLAVEDLARLPDAPQLRKKVDILFMVDNSISTQPKQAELRARFGAFADTLKSAAVAHPASYHIGVVTSDLGAGTNTVACKAGGDGARLQAAAAPNATGVPAACSTFSLGGGVRFIDYDQVSATDNLGGTDLTTAFSCISAVGTNGCGFEHQLESVYRALHDPIAENALFLRPDALLVVVYVTDEDDCSAPPNSDLFDGSSAAGGAYGTLHSFRCTQFGIACGNPAMQVQAADSNGPLSMCRPLSTAEGGKLYEVQKYIDQLTKPAAVGGIKADPNDVIVAAMSATVEPFAVTITMPCADQANTASCPILSHSCVSPTNSQFFGDPPVRLATVVKSAATWQMTSICDSGIGAGLDAIAQKILARLQ